MRRLKELWRIRRSIPGFLKVINREGTVASRVTRVRSVMLATRYSPLATRPPHRYLSVTAPSEALVTSFAYFARVPRVSFGFLRLPCFHARGNFLRREIEGDAIFHRVDDDGIAVLDDADRSTDRGFRRDVADDKSVAATGEASVGDQRDVLAETFAHDGAGRRKHLAHAGAADRAFVANHDHVPAFTRPSRIASSAASSLSNTIALPLKCEAFLAGDFGHGAFGREIAVEDAQVAVAS